MRLLIGLMFISLMSLSAKANIPTDIPRTQAGGYIVPSKKYPAVFHIFMGSARCTGTLIGPNVIITAAHCKRENLETGYFFVGKTKYNFTFTTYESIFSEYVDLAVGIVERDVVGIKPISINFKGDHGQKMIALGYGCSMTDLSENFVRYHEDTYLHSKDYVTLIANRQVERSYACPGDSGGPSLAYNYDLKLQLVSIHLKTDMYRSHIDLKTSSTNVLGFIAAVVEKNNLRVCDYNLECGP